MVGMVGLMVTSRRIAPGGSSWDCCCWGLHPHGGLLPTHASAGDPPTLAGTIWLLLSNPVWIGTQENNTRYVKNHSFCMYPVVQMGKGVPGTVHPDPRLNSK